MKRFSCCCPWIHHAQLIGGTCQWRMACRGTLAFVAPCSACLYQPLISLWFTSLNIYNNYICFHFDSLNNITLQIQLHIMSCTYFIFSKDNEINSFALHKSKSTSRGANKENAIDSQCKK